MKKLILITYISTFIFACEKNSDNGYNLTSIDGWISINFKTNYTIQIPDGFIGAGMEGFEGNTFSKYSTDNKINLFYGYCNDLFCNDFGDLLGNPVPKSVQVRINSGVSVTLNKREYFYQNSEIVGVLYYSDKGISRGRLFWKDSGTLKAALEIDFNLSEIETVNKIIRTIKTKYKPE
jgi:hypothetical protein